MIRSLRIILGLLPLLEFTFVMSACMSRGPPCTKYRPAVYEEPTFERTLGLVDSKNLAEITKFHVNAKVQMRYAITSTQLKQN